MPLRSFDLKIATVHNIINIAVAFKYEIVGDERRNFSSFESTFQILISSALSIESSPVIGKYGSLLQLFSLQNLLADYFS